MLEVKDIRTSTRVLNEDDRYSMPVTDSLGRTQETTFITESGLYKVLFKSRKPIAEQFQDHVSKLLKQQRLELGEKLQLQARKQVAEERERHLIDKHKGKPGVFE